MYNEGFGVAAVSVHSCYGETGSKRYNSDSVHLSVPGFKCGFAYASAKVELDTVLPSEGGFIVIWREPVVLSKTVAKGQLDFARATGSHLHIVIGHLWRQRSTFINARLALGAFMCQ